MKDKKYLLNIFMYVLVVKRGFIFIYNVLNKRYEIINTIYKRIITFRTC